MPSLYSTLALLCSAGLVSGAPSHAQIQWKPCNLTGEALPLSCGTINVPLDYTDKTSTRKLTLDLARIAATKSPKKGSILTNFGGPGELGRESMALVADILRRKTAGYYDIIGFDNRGTGNALPFYCYSNNTDRSLANAAFPVWSNSSDTAIGTQWASSENVVSACHGLQKEAGTLIGTSFTARDIKYISEVLNEDGLIRYWGFSYGTTLGATLAAMFPNKIDRIVLDGVFNPYEYYYSFDYQEFENTDKTLAGFCSACSEAGPSKCSLAASDCTTGQDIESRIYALIDRIKYNPIPISGSLITYDLIKSVILSLLYSPSLYPALADVLSALETGDVSSIDLSGVAAQFGPATLVNESRLGIECSDKYTRVSSLADFGPVIAKAYNTSRFAGDNTPLVAMQCARWNMTAKERYAGDFRVKTHVPGLILSNTYDPVAPVAAGRNLSAALEGSVLLEQHGFGHTTLAQESPCTDKAIVEYFVNGTLPQKGTVCQVTGELFP